MHGTRQVFAIAGQHGFEQGKLQIVAGGAINERAKILRQTGSAEGKARLQVGGRNVQLFIPS